MFLLSMCHSGKTILRLFLCCIFQSRVLSSSSPFITSISPDRVLSLDLNSLLSVLSQAESALQSQHEELKVGHIAPTTLDNQSFNHTRVCLLVCFSGGGAFCEPPHQRGRLAAAAAEMFGGGEPATAHTTCSDGADKILRLSQQVKRWTEFHAHKLNSVAEWC